MNEKQKVLETRAYEDTKRGWNYRRKGRGAVEEEERSSGRRREGKWLMECVQCEDMAAGRRLRGEDRDRHVCKNTI